MRYSCSPIKRLDPYGEAGSIYLHHKYNQPKINQAFTGYIIESTWPFEIPEKCGSHLFQVIYVEFALIGAHSPHL